MNFDWSSCVFNATHLWNRFPGYFWLLHFFRLFLTVLGYFSLFLNFFTFFEFSDFFGPFSLGFSLFDSFFFKIDKVEAKCQIPGFSLFSDFFDGFGPFLTWFIPGKRRFCRFWSFSTFLARFQHFSKVFYPKKRRSENHRRTYRIELNFAPKLDLDERNSPSEFHWKRSRFTDFRPFQSFRQIGLNLGSICCWRYLTWLYLADYRPQVLLIRTKACSLYI